ncbi:MAG TPA: hypothetical protein VHT29_07450 [Solirubrobacteraceae bacterium]|jgi:hypothetical protein|nr:hypothetical protein [Solirubrobacteraceae bacterium]
MVDQSPETLGHLFPAGGRVAPGQMIGREGDVADLVERLREFSHFVLSGPRRAGKTSVCGAACAALRDDHDFLVMEVEVPEQSSAEGVCQLVIDRAARLDLKRISQGLLKAAVPAVESLLTQQGIPLDLSAFGAAIPDATRRTVLELPLAIARQHECKVALFLDELQRAVDYSDGVGLIRDLGDVYAGNSDVVLLVDGSNERTIERLMGAPYSLARLGQRLALAPTIPADQWRAPLRDRFGRAGLSISEHRLERILEFGEERPYDTMVGCLLVGQNARRVQSNAIDDFVLGTGLEEARVRLEEDD